MATIDNFRQLDPDYKPSDISAMIEESQNPEDVQKLESFWREEIKRAEELRLKLEPRWRAARKSYRNRWYPNAEPGKENVSNPTFYSDVEVAVSNIAANPPRLIIKPKRKAFAAQANMVKAALEFESERLDLFETIRTFVMDAFLYNHGVVKIGYNVQGTFEHKADSAFIGRLSSFNYLIDPEANSQKSARYEGEIRFIDENDFKDGDYLNKDRAIKEMAHYVINTEMDSNKQGSDDRVQSAKTDSVNPSDTRYDYNTVQPSKIKRLKVYEIYDKVGQQFLMFTISGTLIYRASFSDIPYLDNSPYVTLRLNIIGDYYYMDSDHDIHESKLYAIDAITNRILEFSKRMLPKLMVRKGAVNRTEINKMLRGVMAGAFEVEAPANVAMSDVASWLPSDGLRPENFQALNILSESHAKDSGIYDYMKGEGSAKTATEAQLIASTASGRAARRMNLLDDAVEQIYTKLFFVLKHTLKDKMWVDIAGEYAMTKVNPDGSTMMLTDNNTGEPIKNKQDGFWLTPDILQSECQIKIDAGSMAFNENMQRQAMTLNMFKSLANHPMIDQQWLISKVVESYGEDPDDAMIPVAGMPGVNPMPQGMPNQTPVSPQMAGPQASSIMNGMQESIDANPITA